MSRLSYIRLTAVLIAGLGVRSLLAQTQGEARDADSFEVPEQSVVSTVSTAKDAVQPASESDQQPQYAAALNGSGLISLDDAEKSLLFSATFGGGWDSNPTISMTNAVSSGIYLISPYIGLRRSSPKARYLLQYQPTFLGYLPSVYTRQTLHTASASMVGSLSPRWEWNFNAYGTYGQNGTRLLASQQTVPVGEVPGAGSGSASYLPNAGTVTYVSGSAELRYRRSERGTFALNGSNSFNRTTGFAQQGSTATARLSYGYDLSPTITLLTYGQAFHSYGDLRCDGFGTGLGVRWQARERTFLSLRGGPEINTSECGGQQGYSYNASFSTRASKKSQLYLMTSYLPSVSYLGPGLWQRSVSGGYQYQVTPIGVISVNAGYTTSTTLTAVSSFTGVFVDLSYSFRLRHGLAVSYAYRGYANDSAGSRFNRNVAQFTLSWTKDGGKIFQTTN